ncbi:hypothetical protein JCM3770_000718 [Rhodotorula araucariae]
MATIITRLRSEFGFVALAGAYSPRDVYLLIASRFIRMAGFGAIAPVLVLYLNLLGISPRSVGLFLSLTLFGDVVLSLVISWIADDVGRRRVLALGSAIMAASGFAFYFSRSYTVLLLAATFGVISPRVLVMPRSLGAALTPRDIRSGNEVGPFSSVEVGILSQLVQPEDRVFVLMHYQVLGFVGLALGSVWSGWLVTTLERDNGTHESYRFIFACYGAIALVKVVLSLSMTPCAELDHPPFPERALPEPLQPDGSLSTERTPLIHISQRPLADRTASSTPSTVNPSTKIDFPSPPSSPWSPSQPSVPLLRILIVVILFAIDSFASSLTPASYVSLYLRTYGASLLYISNVIAIAALSAVFTSLLAGAISKRIGLLLTMVTTHIPAQILTAAMAYAPTLPIAAGLYIARSAISSMDSSIRGALVSAMVPKSSRTRLLGVVDVCRTLAAAPGPFVTGRLIDMDAFRWVFVIGGAIKIGYDLLLLLSLRTAKLQH